MRVREDDDFPDAFDPGMDDPPGNGSPPMFRAAPHQRPLPPDWSPSPGEWAALQSQYGAALVAESLRNFRNHYRASGAMMADWDVRFAGWVEQDARNGNRWRGEPAHPPKRVRIDGPDWTGIVTGEDL